MSSSVEEGIRKTITIARTLGYDAKRKQYQNATRVWCRAGPAAIAVDIFHEENISNIWGYVRTASMDFEGERTDLHEAISTILAAFFRTLPGISCSLWVVPHPVIDIKSEIYASDILFAQPDHVANTFDDFYFKQIEKILYTMQIFWYKFWSWLDWPLCSCEEQSSRIPPSFLYSRQEAEGWAKVVAEAIGEDLHADGVQFNARHNPTWKHYRSVNSKISVLSAPTIAIGLSEIIKYGKSWETLEGINGKLFISDGVHNFISYKNHRLVQKLLDKLEYGEHHDGLIDLIPLENHLLAVGNSHLVIVEHDCGKRRFDKESERIRKRHAQESKLLFPIISFQWSENIDGDEFELLICEILSCEPGVKWIRKVSASREPDNGRDLIAEWRTPPLPGQFLAHEQNPYTERRIVVQCKAFKKSVGKSEVIDIRDTIEHYEAQGYFLAVSSYLTSPLTEHLENLRNGGKYWVDWWTRSEIEEKLRAHLDIAARFPNVVRVQKQ